MEKKKFKGVTLVEGEVEEVELNNRMMLKAVELSKEIKIKNKELKEYE